jgi:hypothetical protein
MNNNCLMFLYFLAKMKDITIPSTPHFDIKSSMENGKQKPNNTTVRQYQVVLQLVPKHSINGGLKIK